MVKRTFSIGSPKVMTAVLKYEVDQNFCRESLTLLGGSGGEARQFDIGTILGAAGMGAATASALVGNVGNGVLTLANPAISATVSAGDYQAICIEPAANAGTFEVFDHNGISVGTATVGVAFNGPVRFTIADGATDFAAGDAFLIKVPLGSKVKEWDPTATDGSAEVVGVSLAKGYAPSGVDAGVLGIVRGPAILDLDGIAWPDGVTTDQKSAVVEALLDKQIIVRAL
jgi:hypothetical protein